MIIKNTIKLTSLLLASTLFLSSCAANNASEKKDTVIATYKGGDVTLEEAKISVRKLIAKNKELKGITFKNLTSEQREALIKKIILSEISFKEAKKRDLHKQKDIKRAIKSFEADLLQRELYFDLAKNASSDEIVKKHYEDSVKKMSGQEEVRLRYISLATKKEADSLYAKLKRKPKTFAYYAKKKSLDKELAKKGGDLGYVLKSQLSVDVAKQAFSLKIKSVSKPIKSKGRWNIIKVENRRKVEIAKFEDIKATLAKKLAQDAIKKFAADKITNAEISISVSE